MLTRIQAGLVLCAALLMTTPAIADDGHGHGAAPAASTGSALPRFAATSELFELVGVVDARQLTVYLDRFADNAPVKGARIDLEVGGAPVSLEEQGDGVFEGMLAQELEPGVTPVTATVTAGNEVDLLGGELDVHEQLHSEAATASKWKAYAGGTAAVAFLVLLILWFSRRSGARRALPGGAA